MNSMNHIGPYCNLRLSPRNEGKIKSYESCRDVRAWSHDCSKRDRYLREWIKCDMPICVLPTCALANFMRNMTCRSRCKATPRCHPDCKSKVVLDSICNSCHAMKECFKNEEDFEKYFEDEEFESGHWPCERCLEALKSIKMFWKIIVEKIFNLNINKSEDLETHECCRTDSVRSVAKVWQTEMVQQAMFVRNITPFLSRTPAFRNNGLWKGTKSVKKEPTSPCNKPSNIGINHSTHEHPKDCQKPKCVNSYTIKSYKVKSTDTDCLSNPTVSRSNRSCASHSRRQNRQCSAKVNMIDAGAETCKEINDEVISYKINLEYLQDKFNCQKKEMEKVKRENSSLRIELNNLYKNSCGWKSTFYTPTACTNNNATVAFLPKPFECCTDDSIDTNKVKSFDSEVIITMKNCKNETYRHISLLQVLHKTNEPILNDLNLESACCDGKEDPIDLLTKVQDTFGEIVKRERSNIANDKRQRVKSFEIDASFRKVDSSKSAPSCSTITVGDSSSSSSNGGCRTKNP